MSRVAVVTGGASGIGPTKAVAVEVDVAEWQSVDAAFTQVRAELGPIEIIVTSGGIESFDPVLDITPDTWDRIVAVNLTGTFVGVNGGMYI